MALTQRLELRQGQSLVMTPQLQQAIKLLQLSNVELAEYIEQELEKNPLLERDERDPYGDREAEEERASEKQDEPLETILAPQDFGGATEVDAERDEIETGEAPAVSAHDHLLTDWTSTGMATTHLGDDYSIERTLSQTRTLKDHLLAQLSSAPLAPGQRLIAVALIDGIDESGYLRSEISEVAEQLGASPEGVSEVLGFVQQFEPTGVGARDLVECLSLQLREKCRLDPAMQALLQRLDLVARRDIAGLCAHCRVDAEDVSEMIAEIRALTPKPGLAFGSEPVQPVVPDVFVRESADGTWYVELNTEMLPRVLVNSQYCAKVSGAAAEKSTREYLANCLNSANWLVKSLDQRARTILKVASEIVRQQDGFFTNGVRHLRPLNLRAIAEAIDMHESTVSRVTSNKYAATPRGIFELKYFFTSAISAVNGQEAHSAEAVRDRIREMVERESSREVLSDDRIVALLIADGIDIARRTVAKYREAMRIPSSVERRRMKQADLGPLNGPLIRR
ncbi:MAG TPA: RNA polymerase factor sigma-54 [Rhizomicrobium sp.]|nr:RNA polymerase factor sigma-54 [Rhizomicrobium sp.]